MLHFLSTILFGPILLLQGLYVRKTIELLPEPKGARQGSSGAGPKLRLLILGDSAAAGVGVRSQDQALLGNLVERLKAEFTIDYILVATTGNTSQDSLADLESLGSQEFDVVLTSLGVNDVTAGKTVAQFVKTQIAIVDTLKRRFSARQIILSGLPPVRAFPALPQPLRWYLRAQAERFNKAVRKLAGKYSVDFIEFEFDGDISQVASDGFHPGAQAYQIWAELAAKRVLGQLDTP